MIIYNQNTYTSPFKKRQTGPKTFLTETLKNQTPDREKFLRKHVIESKFRDFQQKLPFSFLWSVMRD